MHNNDIIKRLRFILDIDDTVLSQCFQLGGCEVSAETVKNFFKSEDDNDYLVCSDEQLTLFLDGLITLRRGPSNKANRNPVALNNNVILKKVRVALELEARDLDNAFMLADCELSPHEISALFRKPGTKHFVPCTDTVFEAFFNGLSLYFRH